MSTTNAEASTSRLPSTSKRGRRESRSKPDKGKGKEVDINDGGKLKSPDPSVGNDGTLSPKSGMGSAREGGSTARRVRTVPPSAIYEPPTPPSPAHAPLPHLENPILSPEPQPAKRRRRLRYSSSSDSSVDSDDEETSDDEPPWWTFTQRGMAKLRAKNLHRNGRDVEQGEQELVGELTEGESGKEKEKESYFSFNKEKHRMSGVFLPSSRRSSKDREGVLPNSNNGSTPSSLKNFRRRSAHNPSPDKLNNPRQATDPSHPGGVKRTKSVPTRPASAPTSPTVEAPSPGMTTLVDDISSRLPSHESTHPLQAIEGGEPTSPRRFSKRQLTAPNFPRFFRRNDTDTEGEHEPLESLTDTEVIPSASARSRVKSSLSKPVAIPGVSSSASTPNGSSAMIRSGTGESSSTPTPMNGIDPGSSTPTRPKNRRRSSHMLRIQLPPPITNRFKDGWPHAGSWQDALYGYYEDNDGQTAVPKSTGVGSGNEENPITPQKQDFGLDEPTHARQITPEQGQGELNGNGNGKGEADLTKRTKSRRQKRYRQALVPPTPSGLGFTPSTRNAGGEGGYPWNQTSDGEGAVGPHEKGFSWDKGLAQKEAGAGGRLNGGENLERHDTMATSMNSSRRGSEKGWWAVRKERKKTKKQRKRRTKEVEADWRQTYRRVLFLDARVTIWIRLMNLVVVVVSLGLAITIRLELEHLRLPGLIGSSTTLVMSYSCLTILHVLTAIYREYFGKPIGLWGLRSKMLWVCLDLLFVGLWSSAISLSTNDLIATPLQCTSDAPWWREGLSDQYSRLLNDLSNLTLIADQSLGQNATTQLISQSVSITLPSTIINSPLAKEACRRQAGVIALSLLSLVLYGGNMVISLFRIFETVRRTANVSKAVTL
uniref:Uncharacterized protein n=1 Tax=Kwoniella bestiolae CBS 10118 TaxID=1296100 RepID=A0A1B9GEN3_9TREE|nr:hypothetical protein I302_01003 [Kwoniella bestiolae CBS 10118]OCF29496.1 hypothetical protein I302_01003 [Kwoniella bestiolae CBS 10118]